MSSNHNPGIDDARDTTSLVLSVATVSATIVCVTAFALTDTQVGVLGGTVSLLLLSLSLMRLMSRSQRRAAAAKTSLRHGRDGRLAIR